MISAVIITLNEERNIGRCIDSLQAVADEIIVLDSHSTDRTREICEGKGVRFEVMDWQGYSKTKNHANSLASHDFILSIDADESLSEDLTISIKTLKEAGLSGCYSFNRLTNYCGSWVRHGGWYPDVKVRIFPKQVEWEGDYVHEELNLKGLPVTHLKGDLLHFSYYDKNDHRARATKYARLAAEKLHANGKKGGTLKPLLSAVGKFISVYLFKGGLLDGKAGWNIAVISAQASATKYRELNKLQSAG